MIFGASQEPLERRLHVEVEGHFENGDDQPEQHRNAKQRREAIGARHKRDALEDIAEDGAAVIFNLMWVPKAQVHITDRFDPSLTGADVANVPNALAVVSE